jgi:hypothetical protein
VKTSLSVMSNDALVSMCMSLKQYGMLLLLSIIKATAKSGTADSFDNRLTVKTKELCAVQYTSHVTCKAGLRRHDAYCYFSLVSCVHVVLLLPATSW